ncbi:phospho-N-acetylmuramoyl-pentapeptide-transferase [Candidatus Jorgensenbacteria bacterium CG10_big_fil_rev_8_21_14_0_10_54_38]|uniref:Phospho-N-acetylmuramoyl-pentapeptide-transferase n=2 Tax=Candidatus Joergenseniibacteriota TaxID=1752739 RepID=A0A2M6WFQ8_9BACT|nr:MAG: phospho-N-acetylmuramoyl-pentapeptide-transferase [Candidatus Jorgensenbacteria bacterium CG23_combo_of_CG06-09_8_20_14_all_54_14]PIT91623.1 MAG: phospho-N-acetylmuramoyl-pentapeptide-transferase [Candidatus Jorgensenbacteria bacterium CG10_big_fil_rev_8_21_14_0_10_54_38]
MEIFEAIRILILFAISFIVALFLTPFVAHFLQRHGLRKKNIRDEASAPIFYSLHKGKSNTPTMGGVVIWLTVLGLALIFLAADGLFDGFATYFNFVNRAETYLPLAALFLAALVGLFDDLFGILGKGPHGGGLSVPQKLALYAAVAAVGAWWFYFKLGFNVLFIPFVGTVTIGWWYIPFFILVLTATAFSANETDGLDGLAGGVLLFSFMAFAVVAFVLHRYDLAAMNAATIGALLAFLWFNIYPARFFMGDTGSMSLGITLGVMAMLTNTALLLPFFAFIFVVESCSVIVQVLSKKIRKKKIFLSTPIHHHFEAMGWPESQVTMRFWIVSAVATTLGLVFFFLARFI